MNSTFRRTAVALAVASSLGVATSAHSSHFRGAAMTPSVSADGILTIQANSYWRQSPIANVCQFPHDCISSNFSPQVSGPGYSQNGPDVIVSRTQDLTDIRRTEVIETFTFDISAGGAGLYTISWSGFSWVSGVPNAGGSYGTTSSIYWDGESANTPILFNLNNVQQEVLRGTEYNSNLGAVAGSGLTLSYEESLSTGMSSQPNGYSISPDGTINITAAGTSLITDNNNNPGADVGFSGEILASDGSSIEFVWVFDGVDDLNVPEVEDQVINALVGDSISTTIVGSDPAGEDLTWDFLSFFGSGVTMGDASFDPDTQLFQWNSTGFGVGQYVASFRATNESGFSDVGTVTINISMDTGQDPTPVPVPGSLLLMGAGLFGMGWGVLRRRRRD